MKLFVLTSLLAAVAFGEVPCPENIKYTNGNYLKRGANFYYQNGSNLLRDTNIYYPNGNTLKRDANIYYANGSYLQRDANLYYPNGGALKRDDNYFYANGSAFKRDANFYYENGNAARRNGKLYRPNGTETPFPVTLTENISEYGMLLAEVAATTERIEVDFRNLVVDAAGTHIDALWTGTTFSDFDIFLNAGAPGENVWVRVNPTGVTCSLDADGPTTPIFNLSSAAAAVSVRVAPGYDPAKVRQALQTTLNSLQLVK